jgi:hypothetical protein
MPGLTLDAVRGHVADVLGEPVDEIGDHDNLLERGVDSIRRVDVVRLPGRPHGLRRDPAGQRREARRGRAGGVPGGRCAARRVRPRVGRALHRRERGAAHRRGPARRRRVRQHRAAVDGVGADRHYSEFFKNIAVFGYFTGSKRLPGPDRGNILCAAFDEGWCWYIPLSDELTSVGAVVHRTQAALIQADREKALMELVSRCDIVPVHLGRAGPAGGGVAAGRPDDRGADEHPRHHRDRDPLHGPAAGPHLLDGVHRDGADGAAHHAHGRASPAARPAGPGRSRYRPITSCRASPPVGLHCSRHRPSAGRR